MGSCRLVIVLSGFPRRSETFALHEVEALASMGAVTAVFATKPGDGQELHPAAQALDGRVEVLPLASAATQAETLVERLDGERVDAVHGYFAHHPTDVAMLAAERLGVPFGFSAHARDVRKVASSALAHRARLARCVIACNADVATTLELAGANVELVPHGVDLNRFAPRPHLFNRRGAVRLLAVGRLVEKKGFDVLIQAMALLEGEIESQLRVIGDGPQRPRLAGMIARLGLERRVRLEGGLTHGELPNAYRWADVVVVPSIVDQHGDRDGLPNVILEALASARPVIASRVAAVDSAVRNDETGLLVPPGDPESLAAAIRVLAADEALCRRLEGAGRALVSREYSLADCTRRLGRVLDSRYALEGAR